MRTILKTIGSWPRNLNGKVILKDSEHAIFYANLIHHNKIFISEVRKIRRNAIQEARELKKKRRVNLDRLFHAACRAQFARECLEEVQRIQDQELQSKLDNNG